MEKMNADIKTDAELITELVEQFQSVSPTQQDITPLLEQLEYYLHQVRAGNWSIHKDLFVHTYLHTH